MKKLILVILISHVLSIPIAYGQEIYQWVDERGTVHFTDDFSLVPERYQDQVKKEKPPSEPAPTSPVNVPVTKPKEPEPDSEPRDILGRGEDWWREKVAEWKQKLTKAQKDYDDAQTALKAKEKELEQSIYKPNSFKRKLKSEIKVLEEQVSAQKKQVDEAKNMLEKVLPKQAQEYRANPSWVEIE